MALLLETLMVVVVYLTAAAFDVNESGDGGIGQADIVGK